MVFRLQRRTSFCRKPWLMILSPRRRRYLFPHEDDPDRSVPRVNNAHDAALKASGVNHFVLYDCRHTWATRAVEAGVDLVTLAAMMGHSRIQMVLRYAHPSQEHQFRAMDMIERHVGAQRAALAKENASHNHDQLDSIGGVENQA